MSIFKKALALLLVIALTAAIAVNVTLAYLVDEKSDVNVMTLGNVEIVQHEYERVVDENGNPVLGELGKDFTQDYGITQSYKLQEFHDGKPAYPAVYTNAGKTTAWDEFQQLWNQVGAPGSNDLFDNSMKNVVDKFVFVENTGKSDCYYRTLIAIEWPEDVSVELLHSNFNTNKRFTAITQSNDFDGTADKGTKSYYVADIKIDGINYRLYNMTYNQVLTPGEVSRPSLLQFYLDPMATNEDCAKFGPSWEVLVVSQAVQTNGFSDAATALNTAFGAITENSHPWKDTVLVDGNNEKELMDALTSGKDVIVNTDIVTVETADDSGTVSFNGNGTDVTLAGAGDGSYGYLSFLPETNKNATVSNLSVTGSGFVEVGHYQTNVNGVYTVSNLTIKDMTSTLANGDKGFTLGCTFAHYGNATLTDCVMTGAKSLDDAIIPVDAGFVNDTTTIVNGGEYGTIYCWSKAIVTIDRAKVDTIYVAPNANKGIVTIKAGTTIDTIQVDYGTNDNTVNKARLERIDIEDGATVGKIVFREKSYTVSEWNAFVSSFTP